MIDQTIAGIDQLPPVHPFYQPGLSRDFKILSQILGLGVFIDR
jgi:hypothetical protein